MNSIIHDEDELKRLVTGFLEADFSLVGFTTIEAVREGNTIRWKFQRAITEDMEIREVVGMFAGNHVVTFIPDCVHQLVVGDTYIIRYTLTWWIRGGDGDCGLRSPFPSPAEEIVFYFTAA
jgi:hypothetical protein